MANAFKHPIIGQEAICPDGLGRVLTYLDEFPNQWIQIATHVYNRSAKWHPQHVQLVPIAGQATVLPSPGSMSNQLRAVASVMQANQPHGVRLRADSHALLTRAADELDRLTQLVGGAA